MILVQEVGQKAQLSSVSLNFDFCSSSIIISDVANLLWLVLMNNL